MSPQSQLDEQLLESVQEMLTNDISKVPQATVNKMLLGLVAGLAHDAKETLEVGTSLQELVAANPSITWLLRNRPQKTLGTIILFFLALELMYHYSPVIFRLFGIPGGVVP